MKLMDRGGNSKMEGLMDWWCYWIGRILIVTVGVLLLVYISIATVQFTHELLSTDLSLCRHTPDDSRFGYLCIKPDHPLYEELQK